MLSFILTAALLLLCPLLLQLGFHWQDTPPPSVWLYRLTESASAPQALLTLALLTLVLWLWTPPAQRRRLLLLVLLSFGSTQLLKNGLKWVLAEPRPFVVAMYQNDATAIKAFYAQSRSQRQELVRRHYENHPLPDFLIKHRSREVGYSFPSGHSIFAAAEALLFVMVIGYGTVGRALASGTVLLWALALMYSRVALGMHYPRDLALSVLLATVIHLGLRRHWLRSDSPSAETVGRPLEMWRNHGAADHDGQI